MSKTPAKLWNQLRKNEKKADEKKADEPTQQPAPKKIKPLWFNPMTGEEIK